MDNSSKKSESQKNSNSVVIGMTGGRDSTVVAYLLKRQGFRCIGVSVNFFPKEFPNLGKYIMPEFNIPKIERVKEICDGLDIEFYATSAINDFQLAILDRLISARLSAEIFPYKIVMTKLLLSTLVNKANKLGVHQVATGHYAKFIKDHTTDSMSILQTADSKYDESYLFSRNNTTELNKILCPLSDLRKDDVIELAKKLSFQYRVPEPLPLADDELPENFINQQIVGLLEKIIPSSMRHGGLVLDSEYNLQISEHKGIHEFYVGQKNLKSTYRTQTIDKEKEVTKIVPEDCLVYVGSLKKQMGQVCGLSYFSELEGIDITKTAIVLAKIGDQIATHIVKLLYKNCDTVTIFFKHDVSFIPDGTCITIYIPLESGGKLLGSGYVKYFGDSSTLDRGKISEVAEEDDREYKLEDLYF